MIHYTRWDLHLHTQFSDGKTSVTELLRFTESTEGYKVLSITDHHFFTLPKIVETPSCLWVPGIEISAQVLWHPVHLTGYGIHINCTKELTEILANIKDWYNRRAEKVYQKRLDFGLSPRPLTSFRWSLPGPVYKSDLIRELGDLNWMTDIKELRQWAKENWNLLYAQEEVFFPKAEELIKAMHNSGLTVCWAHPWKSLFKGEDEELSRNIFKKLLASGIDGIEPFAHKHTSDQTHFFESLAKEHRLLVTGGSDYHGSEGHSISYPLGEKHIDLFLQKIGYRAL